jgi:hypothetical protein
VNVELAAVAYWLVNGSTRDSFSPKEAKDVIMTKLAVRDRAQLVVIAHESCLVVPGVTT